MAVFQKSAHRRISRRPHHVQPFWLHEHAEEQHESNNIGFNTIPKNSASACVLTFLLSRWAGFYAVSVCCMLMRCSNAADWALTRQPAACGGIRCLRQLHAYLLAHGAWADGTQINKRTCPGRYAHRCIHICARTCICFFLIYELPSNWCGVGKTHCGIFL